MSTIFTLCPLFSPTPVPPGSSMTSFCLITIANTWFLYINMCIMCYVYINIYKYSLLSLSVLLTCICIWAYYFKLDKQIGGLFLGNTNSSLSNHQLSIALYLGVGPCGIFPINTGKSTDVVIDYVLFRKHLVEIYSAQLSLLIWKAREQRSWFSGSDSISTLSS